MEQLVAQLERIAAALERLEEGGLMVLLNADNVRDVLEEVKSSTPKQ